MQMTKLNDGVAIPQIGFGTFQIPAGAGRPTRRPTRPLRWS